MQEKYSSTLAELQRAQQDLRDASALNWQGEYCIKALHWLDILVHDRPSHGSCNHWAPKLAGLCSRICGYIEITSCVMPDAYIITFCMSRRRCKMYCGHTCMCVCLSVCPSVRPSVRPSVCVCVCVRDRTPTLLHGPGCNLGAW